MSKLSKVQYTPGKLAKPLEPVRPVSNIYKGAKGKGSLKKKPYKTNVNAWDIKMEKVTYGY